VAGVSPREPPLEPPRHLWVRLPSPLGDAVLATPALRALRAALPGTRITWAGGRAAHEALEGLGTRDDVMPVAGPMATGTLAPLRLARLVRRLGADAALLLTNSFSSALAAFRAGIGVRVGLARDGRRALLTHVVEVPEEKGRLVPRSMQAHYLDLVAPFGARSDGRGPELRVLDFDRERAERRLAAEGPGGPFLGVSPGASFSATKILPPDRLAPAVRLARERSGLVPLVLGGPGEEDLVRATAEAIGGPCVSTHERPPSVGELKALLGRCAVLLTSDAGPRHVAEALGVPTVVWMGPTDPRWSEPTRARLVRVERLACLGCHLKRCPIGLPCMLDLTPESVAEAALAVLASGAPGPR